jgi:hypothetical protein
MNRTTLDPKAIEALMGSAVFKAAQAEQDAQRVAAHRAAVDALAAHERDTAAIDAARQAAEQARKKFEPAQAAYVKALQALSEAEAHLREVTWSRQHQTGRLERQAATHLPGIVQELDRALYDVPGDIRSGFKVKAHKTPLLMGGTSVTTATNAGEIQAAVDFVASIRAGLRELETHPMSEAEIVERLREDCARLCELAAEAGAMVRHLLPELLRGAGPVERPEREGKIVAFAKR